MYVTLFKMTDRYSLCIGNIRRELPIVAVSPQLCVALFNLLGDTELTEEAGKLLAGRITSNIDVLLTPEGKALALAHVVSRETGLPYIAARKSKKPYMTGAMTFEFVSITTQKKQILVLDGKDAELIKGKCVGIIDDVVSSGETVEALKALMKEAGAELGGVYAVLTEGDEKEEVVSLSHLPLFPVE